MKTLNDKKIKWTKKLKAGDPNYIMITRNEDRWYFLTERRVEQILLLKIAVDGGAGLRREYSYTVAYPDTDGLYFTAIMKEERELLIQDGNGLVAFGIEEVESPANALFIYFRTEERHVFVFGGQESCSIKTFQALPLEQVDDEIYMMDDIFLNQETSELLVKNEEDENVCDDVNFSLIDR